MILAIKAEGREKSKKLDKTYHEDPGIVSAYDGKMSRRYKIEHRHYSLHRWIEELKRGGKKNILDFGAGTGNVTINLLRKEMAAVSLDASESMLDMIRKKAKDHGLAGRCVCGDCERLPFLRASFDAVLCFGVLHHLPDIGSGIQEQIRVVKPQGTLYIAEPYLQWPWFSYPYYGGIKMIKGLRDFFRKPRVKIHDRPLNRQELETVLKILNSNKFKYEITYLAYWPVIVALLPEFFGLLLVRVLNSINGSAERADTVLIKAWRDA